MGYAFMVGECFVCKGMFIFNPVRVPSVRDEHNVRQPLCEACVDAANAERARRGLATLVVPNDAYEACEEGELA